MAAKPVIRSLAYVAVLIATQACVVAQDAADVPQIHVILFTPAQLEPPSDAVSTIRDAATYAETFFVEGLERHGYQPARKQIFPRDAQGEIKVHHVVGEQNADSKDYQSAQLLLREMWPKANEQYQLPKNYPIWWVWVYLGDPPTRYGDYRGSSSFKTGGWAVVNLENRPGDINLHSDMAKGVNEEHTLKGCIHELGHALGLLYVGPRVKDRSGNTLMGPRTVVFQSKTRTKEDRVYLSDAEAAMLSRHFVFTGNVTNRGVMPNVAVKNFSARFDRQKMEIRVSGQMESKQNAHHVIVFDMAEPDHLDYWRKAYVGLIDQDKKFQVNVDEPIGTKGTLKLLFCFENGAVTGDGKSDDLTNAFGRKYAFNGPQFRLED